MSTDDDSAIERSILSQEDSNLLHHSSTTDSSAGYKSSNTTDTSKERRVSRNVSNPFESNLLDSLHSTTFSPSVFKTPVAKPKLNGNNFQWSIEQRSRILPAMIDENFSFEQSPSSDSEKEIQKAIDKFWQTNQLIAPSPDIVASRIMKPLNFTPSPIVPFTRRNSSHANDLSDISPISRIKTSQVTRECQTDISLPTDFDLESLLSSYLPQQQQASTPKLKKFASFLDRSTSYERTSLPHDPELDFGLEEPQFNVTVAPEEASLLRGDLGSTIISEISCFETTEISFLSPIRNDMNSTRLSPIKETD